MCSCYKNQILPLINQQKVSSPIIHYVSFFLCYLKPGGTEADRNSSLEDIDTATDGREGKETERKERGKLKVAKTLIRADRQKRESTEPPSPSTALLKTYKKRKFASKEPAKLCRICNFYGSKECIQKRAGKACEECQERRSKCSLISDARGEVYIPLSQLIGNKKQIRAQSVQSNLTTRGNSAKTSQLSR